MHTAAKEPESRAVRAERERCAILHYAVPLAPEKLGGLVIIAEIYCLGEVVCFNNDEMSSI